MAILIPLAGIALGAAGMYLFDPGQGRRRRAVMRDQVNSRTRSLTQAAGATVRDVRNRMRGGAAQLQSWSGMQQGEVPDRVLVERVRAKIGRHTSHPKAVKAEAAGGRIALRGQILASEHHPMLRAVRRVRGVKDVQDLLQVHESAQGISALQGAQSRHERLALGPSTWSPAARAVSGGTGAALVLFGLRRGGMMGALAGAAGAMLVTRAMVNKPLEELAEGIGQIGSTGGAADRRGQAGGTPETGHGAGSITAARAGEEQAQPRELDASGWQSPVAGRTAQPEEQHTEGEQSISGRYPQPAP
jgi:hypothetical protein